MRRVVFTFLFLLTPILLVVSSACDDGPTPHECSNVPLGGCPLARGVSCSDPACEDVYLCRPNNVWELKEHCPAHDAAPRPIANDAGTEAARPSFDASIDAPPGAFGGPGCADLQTPECSLGLALACGSAGCCDCEELFVCENGGWALWGVCGDAGIQQR